MKVEVSLSRAAVARLCLAAVLAVPALFGCAATAPKTVEPEKPVFIPLPPDPPRLQFLRSYNSSKDVKPLGSFAKFVVGEEEDTKTLGKPYGAAIHDGKIFIADTGLDTVVVMDLKNKAMDELKGNSGGGRLKGPTNVTVDTDGKIYVSDPGRGQVMIYDRDQSFLTSYGAKDQFKPTDTAIRGDALYVCDIKDHQVEILDKNTGKVLSTFGKPGSNPGELFHPTNIALDKEGNIFVTDTGNFRVQKFDPQGKHLKTYGKLGDGLGHFTRPKGVAVDHEGRVYVVDAAFENVQIFDSEGRLLLFFGGPGTERGNLTLPAAISIDYDNIDLFREYIAPGFKVEYLLIVINQYGERRVSVFGFGHQ